MDIIQLLPEHIANQIAAGEVVQRPASVVKELLENSVDADSTAIHLIIKDAGKTLVQVVDNGRGMSETDARMCFERHATSKIKRAEDLFYIRTMGFRGEAMASIAAVAQVEMKTRRPEDELGSHLIIEGSNVMSHEPCQAQPGTTTMVKNLFYNIPARRNFLKSNTIEWRHILEEFQRVALAYPAIHFTLHHNGEEVLHLPSGNLRQRVVGILGAQANKKIIPVNQETEVLLIDGFVSKPEFSRKSRGEQFFFVNNRFIRSSYLHHAVMGAYENLLSADSHPSYVLFIQMDPARLDVNVHPTKQEIKFDDERLVYNYLRVAIKHSLGQFTLAPQLDFDSEPAFETPLPKNAHVGFDRVSSSLNENDEPERKSGNSNSYSRPEKSDLEKSNLQHWQKLYEGLETLPSKMDADENASDHDEFSVLTSKMDLDTPLTESKPLTQILNRYILVHVNSGILLIDQQAAHERVLFERYLLRANASQPTSQQLLFPVTLRLSAADAEILKEITDDINRMGIDIREFGGNTFVVHGMPPEVQAGKEEEMIDSIIEQYRTNTSDLNLNLLEKLASAMARRAAKRRGTPLNREEMQEIVDQLFASENPQYSPTGRKCMIELSVEQLEELFF